MSRTRPLSDVETRRLGEWLEPANGKLARYPFVSCEGFLAGIASGPKPIPEDEWLPVIHGDLVSDRGSDTTGQIVALLQRWRDEIATDLQRWPQDFSPFIAGLDGKINPGAALLWAAGYFDAIKLRYDDWKPLFESDQLGFMVPIVDLLKAAPDGPKRFDAAKARRAGKRLADSAVGIYQFWHGRPADPPDAGLTVHRLKIALSEIEPTIWRRVEIRSDTKLTAVSRILLAAMGWSDTHLHEFVIDHVRFGTDDPDFPRGVRSERNRTLAEIARRKGDRFDFEYDFGDGWSHQVAVEDVALPEPTATYPRCLDGARACPPEDCGGVGGYEQLLEALGDSAHSEHERLLEWVGGSYDPAAFDLAAVNRALKKYRRPARRSRKPPEIDAHLTADERDELERLLGARNPSGPLVDSATRLHGFLTSIISGPIVMPSEWLSVVFGEEDDRVWDSIDQARDATALLMRFHNEIAADLQSHDYGILIDRLGDADDALDLADDWCKGYLTGVNLREVEWQPAFDVPQLAHFFSALRSLVSGDEALHPLKDPDGYRAALDAVTSGAAAVYDWWRARFVSSLPPDLPDRPATFRRGTPKISRNAPCPCGSGKKYKRCCSPLQSL